MSIPFDRRVVLLLALLCLILGMPTASSADDPPTALKEAKAESRDAADGPDGELKSEVRFVRLRKDAAKEPVALETSITRYVPASGKPQGLYVDLVGAIHVGEREYYEQLNQLFDDYDAVLFELVAPEGTKIPRGGRKSSGLSLIASLQRVLKNTLDLEFQLEHVDYTKKNMVHADMSPGEFAESMEKRGESFFKMFFKMMGQAMAMQSKSTHQISDAQLFAALMSRDRAFQL